MNKEKIRAKTQRCTDMLLLVLDGKTYKEIGKENGISGQRVRQLSQFSMQRIRFFCRNNNISFPCSFYPSTSEMRQNKQFFIDMLNKITPSPITN